MCTNTDKKILMWGGTEFYFTVNIPFNGKGIHCEPLTKKAHQFRKIICKCCARV